MNDILTEQISPNQFELPGLRRESFAGLTIYLLEFTDRQPSTSTIFQLKELLRPYRVAVEIGPGNQLKSLLFAAEKARAEIVIGIDPNFDFGKIKQSKLFSPQLTSPKIILLKGDGWGDRRIKDLFGKYSNNIEDRLAIYAQLVAPDTAAVEQMIQATCLKTRGGGLIVLDSGVVEAIKTGIVPLDVSPSGIKEQLLKKRGIENPTLMDWINRILLKDYKMKRMTEQEYQEGANHKVYPPTSFLRKGEMVVWEKLISTK